MLSQEGLDREIANVAKLIAELELAMAIEDNPDLKKEIKITLGHFRAGRSWLLRIQKNRGQKNNGPEIYRW